MAWITKPSGTMQIERRDEPWLTKAMRDDITRNYLPRYETKLAALLPTLHLVQHEYGWIPAQVTASRADRLDYLRAVMTYVAVYYFLWALADVLILIGGWDLGWALRILPNQLYYAFFVPFVYFKFFARR